MGVETDRPLTRDVGGAVFWGAVVVGWSVIGFGVIGGILEANRTHPRSWAIWLIGCLVAHDFVLAPVVFIVGRTLRRVTSGMARRLVQILLILSGAIVVVSIPVLGRFGERPDNPTLLPRNYAVGLVVTLVAAWVSTAAVFIAASHRR